MQSFVFILNHCIDDDHREPEPSGAIKNDLPQPGRSYGQVFVFILDTKTMEKEDEL